MALSGFKNNSNGNKGKSKFEPLSEGVHTGRLVQIIDLGVQQDEYQGVVSERHKVFFTFEIPGETVNVNASGQHRPSFPAAFPRCQRKSDYEHHTAGGSTGAERSQFGKQSDCRNRPVI